MQDRARVLLRYNDELKGKIEELQENRDKTKKTDEVDIRLKVQYINKVNEQIEELQRVKVENKKQMEVIKHEHSKSIKHLNVLHVDNVQKKNDEISLKKEEMVDIKNWLDLEVDKVSQRDKLEGEIASFKAKYQNEMKKIKDDKAFQIDKLRREMLMKIKNVKNHMLTMTEHQLQGTTKLTVKQNLGLTGELEYQSRQTENLTYQNAGMITEIRLLQVELGEHIEVENELAKRSYFCNKVIKKYK